jgi:hypothetical protein
MAEYSEYQDTLFGLDNTLINRIFRSREPFIERLLISPVMAAAWLGANRRNRKRKPYSIEIMTNDILEGRWHLTGETIKVANTGLFLDGQNRLFACMAADTPIDTFVAFNLDEDVFRYMDQGSVRQLGDTLTIRGVPYAVTVAAVARFIMGVQSVGLERHIARAGATRGLSKSAIEEFYDNGHAEDIDRAAFYANKVYKLMAKSMAGGLFYFMAQRSAHDAEIFFESLASGADLSSKHPIHLLREKLFEFRSMPVKARNMSVQQGVAIIHAWNLYRAGKEAASLRIGSIKNFPEIQ